MPEARAAAHMYSLHHSADKSAGGMRHGTLVFNQSLSACRQLPLSYSRFHQRCMSLHRPLFMYAKAKPGLPRSLLLNHKTPFNALRGHVFIDLRLLDQKLPSWPRYGDKCSRRASFSLFLWLKCCDPFSHSSQQSRGDIHL